MHSYTSLLWISNNLTGTWLSKYHKSVQRINVEPYSLTSYHLITEEVSGNAVVFTFSQVNKCILPLLLTMPFLCGKTACIGFNDVLSRTAQNQSTRLHQTEQVFRHENYIKNCKAPSLYSLRTLHWESMGLQLKVYCQTNQVNELINICRNIYTTVCKQAHIPGPFLCNVNEVIKLFMSWGLLQQVKICVKSCLIYHVFVKSFLISSKADVLSCETPSDSWMHYSDWLYFIFLPDLKTHPSPLTFIFLFLNDAEFHIQSELKEVSTCTTIYRIDW